MNVEEARGYAIGQLFGPPSAFGFKALESLGAGRSDVERDVNGIGVAHDAQVGRESVAVLLRRPTPYGQALAQSLGQRTGGVPVMTQVVGEFHSIRPLLFLAGTRRQRVRPAPGGVSIGHRRVTAGTLGCIVQGVDREPYILSNNHVLANSNNTLPSEPVYQPGPYDGGSSLDDISKVVSWVPLTGNSVNYIDAALAKPNYQTDVATSILDIGRIRGTIGPGLEMRVRKSGRTTGLTQGVVTILRAYVQVNYGNLGSLTFDDQIVIQPGNFSSGGDSGSLIVDDENRAVGLLFAGSEAFTLANPIQRVFQGLQIASIL